MMRIDSQRHVFAEEIYHRFGLNMESCPFCTSRDVAIFYASPFPHAVCVSCGAEGPPFDSKKNSSMEPIRAAAQLWNQRGPRPTLERRS